MISTSFPTTHYLDLCTQLSRAGLDNSNKRGFTEKIEGIVVAVMTFQHLTALRSGGRTAQPLPINAPSGLPARQAASHHFLSTIGVETTTPWQPIARADIVERYGHRFTIANGPVDRTLQDTDLGSDDRLFQAGVLYNLGANGTLVKRSSVVSEGDTLIASRLADGEMAPVALVSQVPWLVIGMRDNTRAILLDNHSGAEVRTSDLNHFRWTSMHGRYAHIQIPVFPTVHQPSDRKVEQMLATITPWLLHRQTNDANMRVLVVGGGAGPELAVLAGELGIPTDVVDTNPIAVSNAMATAAYLGISPLLSRIWMSDGLDAVSDSYDAIIHIGTVRDDPALQDSLMAQASQHLRPDGRLFLYSQRPIPPAKALLTGLLSQRMSSPHDVPHDDGHVVALRRPTNPLRTMAIRARLALGFWT
jgi:protein-L-isoaspartate O-methyltransferase